MYTYQFFNISEKLIDTVRFGSETLMSFTNQIQVFLLSYLKIFLYFLVENTCKIYR